MVGQIFNSNNKHIIIRPDQMQLEITIRPVINGRKSTISMEQIHQQVFLLIYLKITTTIIGNIRLLYDRIHGNFLSLVHLQHGKMRHRVILVIRLHWQQAVAIVR